MPLYRRIPKRGFTSRNHKEIVAINLSVLERFEDGAEVSVASLIEAGVVKNPRDGVNILGNGELTKPYVTLLRSKRSVWDYSLHSLS